MATNQTVKDCTSIFNSEGIGVCTLCQCFFFLIEPIHELTPK